jgi:hypothetical protein
VPNSFEPGSYNLKVEVLVNGRLFTPVTKTIEVAAEPPVVSEPVISQPVSPQPSLNASVAAPVPSKIGATEPTWQEALSVPAEPVPSLPIKKIETQKQPLLKKLAAMSEEISRISPQPAPRKPTATEKPAKKPTKSPLLETAKSTSNLTPKVDAPTLKVQPVTITPTLPVVLEKGTIIYE